jgi:hypothetical protein
MAPTTMGEAVLDGLALAPALAGVLAPVLAGALLELDDDEQPAAARAAMASAAAATPADLRPARLPAMSLRVIFASFLPRYQAGPGG